MGASKTFVPYTGTALPGNAEVVTLFNSVTAFGAKNMHNAADVYWISYGVVGDKNTTNTITADFSSDGGTTWTQFYTSGSKDFTGTPATPAVDEIFVGPFQDVRVRYTNGATTQTVFKVAVSLDAKERGQAVL